MFNINHLQTASCNRFQEPLESGSLPGALPRYPSRKTFQTTTRKHDSIWRLLNREALCVTNFPTFGRVPVLEILEQPVFQGVRSHSSAPTNWCCTRWLTTHRRQHLRSKGSMSALPQAYGQGFCRLEFRQMLIADRTTRNHSGLCEFQLRLGSEAIPPCGFGLCPPPFCRFCNLLAGSSWKPTGISAAAYSVSISRWPSSTRQTVLKCCYGLS